MLDNALLLRHSKCKVHHQSNSEHSILKPFGSLFPYRWRYRSESVGRQLGQQLGCAREHSVSMSQPLNPTLSADPATFLQIGPCTIALIICSHLRQLAATSSRHVTCPPRPHPAPAVPACHRPRAPAERVLACAQARRPVDGLLQRQRLQVRAHAGSLLPFCR